MTLGPTKRGFGLFAGVSAEVIRATAAEAEALGYDSFWVNHPGQVDGLAALAQATEVTRLIKLGVGVIPLTQRGSESIVEGVVRQRLPLDRLLLGIGSPNPGALRRVREGIIALRGALPAHVVLAALGPRMCQVAGEMADGVLFNWLTPEHAQISAAWVRQAALQAARPAPTLYAYVRSALGPNAATRLAAEAARYEGIPAYAAHFDRMGKAALETSVQADTAEGIQAGLAAWDGVVDEVVVRAVTANDTVDQTLALLRAAAPRR